MNGRISGTWFAPICGFAFADDERCHSSLVTFAFDSILLYLGLLHFHLSRRGRWRNDVTRVTDATFIHLAFQALTSTTEIWETIRPSFRKILFPRFYFHKHACRYRTQTIWNCAQSSLLFFFHASFRHKLQWRRTIDWIDGAIFYFKKSRFKIVLNSQSLSQRHMVQTECHMNWTVKFEALINR